MKHHFISTKDEFIDIIIIVLVLSFLFTLTIQRFQPDFLFIPSFTIITLYLFILLYSRLIFMKIYAYYHSFEIYLHQTTFSKFGPRKFDSISAISRDFGKTPIKGIPTLVIAIFIYILSFGFIIFTSVWRYSKKKIPHKHHGTQQKFEYQMPIMYNREISDYRFMKVLFMGQIYYLFMALMLWIFIPLTLLFPWLFLITFWLAYFSLLPIPGTEGYDFFNISRLAYIASIVILSLGMLSLIVFSSLISIISITIGLSLLIIFILFYKYFL